jgi:hypothetical protein
MIDRGRMILCMNPYEPLPHDFLPKDLQHLPDAAAHEIYIYRAVSRGPARAFCEDIENRERRRSGLKEVEFRLLDVVLYFAKVAGEGVIGNLAYSVVSRVVGAIRKPRKELGKVRDFEFVISKRKYTQLRREQHPGTRPTLKTPTNFIEEAESQYKLMVTLKRTFPKKRSLKRRKS